MPVEATDLDQMQAAYKIAVDHWIAAIRESEQPAATIARPANTTMTGMQRKECFKVISPTDNRSML